METILLDNCSVKSRQCRYTLQASFLAAHPSRAQAPRSFPDVVVTLVNDHGITSAGHDEACTCNGDENGEFICCNLNSVTASNILPDSCIEPGPQTVVLPTID